MARTAHQGDDADVPDGTPGRRATSGRQRHNADNGTLPCTSQFPLTDNVDHFTNPQRSDQLHGASMSAKGVDAREHYSLVQRWLDPFKTIKTNVIGTLNMLGLAKRVGARILLTSTSEVYGDPLEHPQKEEYWGNVNPIGVPALSPSQDMCPCTMGELM
ncbi:hypothetical protein Taro_000442, partial [Colocasia esculenta]|nr:hypothetical protein [Colocasia esculenta]